MRRILLLIAISTAIIVGSCSNPNRVEDPSGIVNPFIGTGGHGHTFPGATTPLGMVQLSPDTRQYNWDAASGYHYTDSTIIGFSHTHLSGTGCNDLGDILIRPTTLTYKEIINSKGAVTPALFSHSDEEAKPGYYTTNLIEPKGKIRCELTTTPRVGVHRYTFPQNSTPQILLDLNHELGEEQIDSMAILSISEDMITGYKISTGWTPGQKVYFAARFSEPISPNKQITTPLKSESIRVLIDFKSESRSIEIAVAISQKSIEGAVANLNQEAPIFKFEHYQRLAAELWRDKLSPITVKSSNPEQLEIFYTALYHCYMAPNLTTDVNDKESLYSTLSLWDTFRTWHPLMTILERDKVDQIINSMLQFYRDSGELPIWPLYSGETGTMIGYHSTSVIVDAWNKGIRGFNGEEALKAMVASSKVDRKGNPLFRSLGYIPSDIKRESVSCALEYSYNDWCIAQFADSLGSKDIAEEYYKSSQNYKNVFDGNSGFFRGKRRDGNWSSPFNPIEVSRDMTEATPWQYRFSVPHDVNGLINLMGGKEQFRVALDNLFSASEKIEGDLVDITGLMGQYAHGNEPSHHIAYLYNYIDMGWRSQELIHTLRESMYDTTPEGIIGNEDCGQMSAWYIMSSLGFYPVVPGSSEYILTTPLFKEVEMKLEGDKKFTIVCDKDPETNIYIERVLLNGKELNRDYIRHQEIEGGGVLEFILSSEPQKEISKTTKAPRVAKVAPYSLTKELQVSTPYIEEDLGLFKESSTVTMGVTTPNASIYYTTDGTRPNREAKKYSAPFTIDRSSTIKVIAYRPEFAPSQIYSLEAKKAIYKRGVEATENNPLTGGIEYQYFEGYFQAAADIEKATPKKSGNVSRISLSMAEQEDHFGLKFEGYLRIEKDDVYQFSTTSDDGSVLWIDGVKVVDNDGSHAAVKATGRAALKEGLHPFTLIYIEDYEGHSLEATVSSKELKERDLSTIIKR